MQYNIKVENLKLIIKKYNIDLFSQFDREVTSEDIGAAIDSLDIFEKKNDSKNLNDIRKIAYLTVNPEYQNIQLEMNNNQLFFINNHSVLAALYNCEYLKYEKNIAIMLKEEVASEIGDILIPIDSNSLTKSIKEYKTNNFSWNDLNKISTNIWSDKEYIISNFYNYQFEEILKLSDKTLWDDPDFFARIPQLDSAINYLPLSIAYNDALFEVVKNDSKLLSKIFDYHYSQLFSDSAYDNPIIKLEEEQKVGYTQENEVIITKAKQIKKKFIELIEDKNIVINTLKENESISLYQLCSDKIKYDKEIVSTLFTINNRNLQVESYLPKDIFKDEDILVNYLSTSFGKCKNIKAYPFIYQDWIKDKEKLLKYVQLVRPAYPNPLVELLPKVLKNDKDVLAFFITQDYHIYEKLAEPFRMSKKLLFSYVKSGAKSANCNFVPTYVLEYLDKEEKMMVIENMPYFMLKKDFPIELRNDISMISCCGSILNQLCLSPEQLEQLSRDTEKAKKVIKAKADNFEILTDTARKNPDIVFSFVFENRENEYILKKYEPLIPQSVWCSKSFCLNLIKNVYYNIPILQKIPKQFWNDIDFIKEIAKEIDQNDLRFNAFNNGPTIINELINTHKIEEGNVEKALLKLISQSQLEQRLEEKLPPKENKIKKNKI